MKKVIIALAALMVTVSAYGQGSVVFNNIVSGVVNARVLMPDNVTGAGAGFTAQLFGGAPGTPAASLTALTPTTTFRTTSANAQGYVNSVNVEVPGIAPGSQATLVMRAFNGANFASSSIRGESSPITIALGGGTLPPANLVGLQGFTMVPEPTTLALGGLLGAALLLFRRRK